jgi:hypothetical protein
MRSLLRLGAQPTGPLSDAERIAIVRIALQELQDAGAWPFKQMKRDTEMARSALKGEFRQLTDPAAILYRFATTRYLEWQGGWPDNDFDPALEWVGGDKGGQLQKGVIMHFLDAIDAMRSAQFAVPALDASLPGAWSEKQYRDAFKIIARGFDNWIVQGRKILKLSDDLRPTFISFLGLVTTLSNLESSRALSLGLVKGAEDDGVVYLLN